MVNLGERSAEEVGGGVYLIDLELEGYKGFGAAYLLVDDKKMLVETGPAASHEKLLETLRGLDIKPEDLDYIALTHIHLDHGGGVGHLAKRAEKVKIFVHEAGVQHLINPSRLWASAKEVLGETVKELGKPLSVPPGMILPAHHGLGLRLGKKFEVKIHQTRGHAPHHIALFEENNRILFPGDEAGARFLGCVVPATPAPNFNFNQTLKSIERFIALRPKAICFSHFGTVEDPNVLKTYRGQLELWREIIAGFTGGKKIDRDRILEEILEKDAEVKRLTSLLVEKKTLPMNLIRRILVVNIDGFIRYLTERQDPYC
ncbi:MAG: MBL fold metallo-hydrolase [Candidatus Bathyarchaeia archaeon]